MPTKAQGERIISIIENDATSRGYYVDPDTGDMCVIGGLLASVDPTLLRRLHRATNTNGIHELPEVNKLLIMHFGLTLPQQCELQYINDNHEALDTRRKALKERVINWVIEQEHGR